MGEPPKTGDFFGSAIGASCLPSAGLPNGAGAEFSTGLPKRLVGAALSTGLPNGLAADVEFSTGFPKRPVDVDFSTGFPNKLVGVGLSTWLPNKPLDAESSAGAPNMFVDMELSAGLPNVEFSVGLPNIEFSPVLPNRPPVDVEFSAGLPNKPPADVEPSAALSNKLGEPNLWGLAGSSGFCPNDHVLGASATGSSCLVPHDPNCGCFSSCGVGGLGVPNENPGLVVEELPNKPPPTGGVVDCDPNRPGL